jgi:cation:H+ antiporter
MIWIQLAICFAILIYAGARLTKYADTLAQKTKLGGLWIGLVLVATITSIPETIASASAAGIFNDDDLALSTLYGGNTFNLLMIGVMDLLNQKLPLLKAVNRRQVFILFSGIILLTVSGIAIVMGSRAAILLGTISLTSIFLLLLYFVLLHYQQTTATKEETQDGYLPSVWRSFIFKLILASSAVVIAGVWLSYIGEQISIITGFSSSFVGALVLGITTSAPEVIVSLTALRIGAIDLAVANMAGSIMYRASIIVVPDIFGSGSILTSVSGDNLVLIAAAIIMALVAIIGINYPGRKQLRGLFSWYTPVIIGIYLLSAFIVFSSIE